MSWNPTTVTSKSNTELQPSYCNQVSTYMEYKVEAYWIYDYHENIKRDFETRENHVILRTYKPLSYDTWRCVGFRLPRYNKQGDLK